MTVGLLFAPLPANAVDGPAWPNSPRARREILALLETLESALLSHNSATLVLDDWCLRHHLAGPDEKIVAERVTGEEKPATAEQRALLQVDARESVRYRRVRLRCGAHILSEADNWYVPARLSPAMNATLDTTDISFGRVVQPLHFRRRTLSSRLLWSPLPPPRHSAAAMLSIPNSLIEQRALLTLADGQPFSMVAETYTSGVLAFAPPDSTR